MTAQFQGYTPSNTGGGPSGGAGGITVEDEGTPLATLADTLDFVGAGVTASGIGAEKTITIPGGGAASLPDLSDVVSAANTNRFALLANGTTGYVGRAIVEADISDLQAYLTAEVNDLTASVTWADVPNTNITEGSVTQHQAALSITESQISDLQHTVGVSGLGTWKYRTEITAPPASGQIRFDNANISAATEFYLHETNEGGADVSTFLELLLQDGSVLYMQDKTDGDNFVIIEISSSTDNGAYRTFGIQSIQEQGTEPGQNDDVILLTTGVAGAGVAGGDVFKVGTPVNNQLGVWTGDGTLEGDVNLVWSGTILTVGGTIQVANSGGGAILNEQVTSTNPSLIVDRGDVDTGFGSGGTNNLAVIVGGQTYATYFATGAGDGALSATYDLTTGKTASTTQTQGQAVQNSGEYTEVTTVANANDVITLGSAAVGRKITIVNRGANVLQIFPTSGGDLGQGLNASTTLAVGHSITWIGAGTAGVWAVIGFSDDQLGSVSFPLLADDGSAGAPSYSWTNDPDTGWFRTSSGSIIYSSNGSNAWQITGLAMGVAGIDGPFVLRETPTGTNPVFVPASTDQDTGIGSAAADQLSLIAGGAEIARATEALNANQFAIGASGASSVPDLTGLGDTDTGFRWAGGNVTNWLGGGSIAWNFQSTKFSSAFSNGPGLLNEVSSLTNPTVVGDHADPDTGLGANGNDTLALIAGGVEGLRVTEVAAVITVQAAGSLQMSNTSGPQLFNAAGTTTVPSLVPSRADPNTGFSAPGGDNLNLIAGSVQGFNVAESASVITNTTFGNLVGSAAGAGAMLNEAATFNNPSIVPNKTDDDTGIGYGGSDVLDLIAGASNRVRLTSGDSTFRGDWASNSSAGPALLDEDASSTNPTLVPNQADDDTGIGRDTVDGLALIAGGVSCMRVREIAAAPAVGFYTTTPIIQQTGVAVTAGGIHAALVALGIFTA